MYLFLLLFSGGHLGKWNAHLKWRWPLIFSNALFFHLMIPQGEKRNEIKVGLYA
jgi:hypothetical protein